MSESRDSGRPQRYCTSCGSQVRLGNAFCTSCGEKLASTQDTAPSPHDPPMETEPQPGDSLAAFAGNIRRLLDKLAWWFKNLPLTVRALLVGITSLALFLALLSPTTSVLAVAAFGCSLVAL